MSMRTVERIILSQASSVVAALEVQSDLDVVCNRSRKVGSRDLSRSESEAGVEGVILRVENGFTSTEVREGKKGNNGRDRTSHLGATVCVVDESRDRKER